MVAGSIQQADTVDWGRPGSGFMAMQLLQSLNIQCCEGWIAIKIDRLDVRHDRSVGVDRRINISITGFMGVFEAKGMAQFVEGDAGPAGLTGSCEG